MKQKYLTILLIALMCVAGAKVFAYDVAVKNADGIFIYYKYINNKTELAVTYNGHSYYWDVFFRYTDKVTIPESVTSDGYTYNVTSIDDCAFYNCENLVEVTLPKCITSIGKSAFSGCERLTEITIPPSTTYIGDGAFGACESLTAVNISDIEAWCKIIFSDAQANPLYYAKHLYLNGQKITNLVIPNNVTSINNHAFAYCSDLQSVTIGSGVLSIASQAFYKTSPTKFIWLPNTPPSPTSSYNQGTINYVPNSQYPYSLSPKIVYPFLSSIFEVNGIKYVPVSPSERICDAIDCVYNESAENIYIGNTVTNQGIALTVRQINPYTFYDNTYIKNVKIETSGTVGEYAFYNCNNMKTITLGDQITSLGNNAFQGCSKLQTIAIPDAIHTMGTSVFADCSSLVSVQIGKNIQTIKDYTFSGCSMLTEIEIPRSIATINDYVFYGCSSLKKVIIHDETSILQMGSNGANPLFADCPLESIYIGRNISYNTNSKFGYSPFYHNISLKSVTIGNGESKILDNEFYGCTNLKNVTIGSGVTSIGDRAFSGCSSLDYFEFGPAVRAIGKEAFSDCISITKLVSHAVVPPICDTQALDDINKWTCTLFVPQNQTSAYQQAEQWKEFFFINDNVSKIDIHCMQQQSIYYNLYGKRLNYLQHGLNLIHKNDGTTRKVIIK